MTFLSGAVVLARKDLRCELRSGRALAAAAVLGAGALFVVGLALGPDTGRLRELGPVLVAVPLLFAGLAITDRLERNDRESAAFEAVWLALPDRRAAYLGRVLATFVVVYAVEVVLWLLAVPLAGLPARGVIAITLLVAPVAAIALAATLVLAVALAAAAPGRVLLVPVVGMPLAIPTLVGLVGASRGLLDGAVDGSAWLALLAIEATLLLGVGLLTFEAAVAPE